MTPPKARFDRYPDLFNSPKFPRQYVVCDVDGVLAHRPKKLDDGTPTNPYDYLKVGCEHVDVQAFNLIKSFIQPVIILTARSTICRQATEDWFYRNLYDPYILVMKPMGLDMDDVEFKRAVIDQMIHRNGDKPMLVIDDRKDILDELRDTLRVNTFHYDPKPDPTIFHW